MENKPGLDFYALLIISRRRLIVPEPARTICYDRFLPGQPGGGQMGDEFLVIGLDTFHGKFHTAIV